MKVFSNTLQRSGHSKIKKIAAVAAVFLALTGAGVAGVSVANSRTVDAATSVCGDDSTNSIIRNGANSKSAFITKVKASPELQALYASRGLSASDYSRFISSAKPGLAMSNNTIVVGGKVVATDAGSLGRLAGCQGTSPRTFTVGSHKYYGNLNSRNFASGTKSIPVDVLFNSKGEVQFAVMTADCANPTYQTPVKPDFACKELKAAAVSGSANTFNFTTDASAGHGATITKLVYDFGDGSAKVTTTSATTVVKHTFTKDSTVTVSVTVSLPGGGTVVLVNCKKVIKFTPPVAAFACNLLTATPGKVDDQGNQTVAFVAKATATNATIKSYNFVFGDTKTATVPTSASTASTSHLYAPGTFTATVTVTVLTNTGQTKTTAVNTNCSAPVTVKPPQVKPSTLTCVSLTPVLGTPDQTTGDTEVTLTATASTTNNATISSYVFTFDGTDQPPVSSSATTATTMHTFAPGNHTVSVTVKGKDTQGNEITAPASTNCSQQVNVKTPECKPGVPGGSKECFTYTCDAFDLTQGDNRTVTISNFKASTTNPDATLASVTVDWGDTNTESFAPDIIVGKTHPFSTDTSTVKATAHFTVGDADITASGENCTKPVNFVTPPTTPPTTPQVEAATLVNTGVGSTIGLFVAATIVGTLGYRLFLGRRLSRQD